MAFSSVPTVVTGQTWTAANHNTYIKDNFAAVWVGTAAGDIDYYTSSTTKARLAKGAAYQLLAMNAGATAPAWRGFQAAAIATKSGQTIAHNTNTIIQFATEEHDDYGIFDLGTNNKRATVPTGMAGVWLAAMWTNWNSNATGVRQSAILVNTESYTAGNIMGMQNEPALGYNNESVVAADLLAAGGYFTFWVLQTSGGDLTVNVRAIVMFVCA